MDFNQSFRKDLYQVFLFTGPASIPVSFAAHPWFVLNIQGELSRYEVFWKSEQSHFLKWGHLHKDFYLPTQGLSIMPFTARFSWGEGKLQGMIEGDENSLAKKMIDCILETPEIYPYCNEYSLFYGPNSVTYVDWVLQKFPESGLTLPWNSFARLMRRQ